MLTTLLLLITAQDASAQTASPAPRAAAPLGGPVVPGVCLLSRQAVLANAKVTVAATTRLQQLATEAQAEIDADRAPIDRDIAAFNQAAATLPADQRAQRKSALEARLAPITVKTTQRNREIEATRAKAMDHISEVAQPLIAQAYTARKCGLLIDRNTVIGGNFTNDLTPDVVKALDLKMTTISFNREILPPAVQPAPPAAARVPTAPPVPSRKK